MNNDKKTIMASTCLLISIADSDLVIEKKELSLIKEIISDFFQVDNNNIDDIILESQKSYLESTDLFSYSKTINQEFTYQDKLDFICCIYEVAFADEKLHYMESHTIKKIADMINVEKSDLIGLKKEMQKILK